MKRLGIYFFYDKDGIVDDYIPYMLKNLRPFCEEVCFVSNGKINQGKKGIEPFIDVCLERENKGFDVGAYKEALFHYGWDKLAEYDEVIMMNYTLFGPVYPFDEMFEKMDAQKDLDFWGITKHHGVPFDPTGCCKYKEPPAHIQSSFWGLRRSLINSLWYQQFMEDLPEIKSYYEACGLYEVIFTQDLINMGFNVATYIDTDDMEDFTWYPLMNFAKEIVKIRKCPIFKVKSFSENHFGFLRDGYWNSAVDLRNFIENETDYDFNYVWQHIIRTANIVDIQRDMHLVEIPSVCEVKVPILSKKTVLLMHLDYVDTLDICLEYIYNVPIETSLIITVSDSRIKEQLENKLDKSKFRDVIILDTPTHGKELLALFVTAKDYVKQYDYVCLIHDLDLKKNYPYGLSVGELRKNLENCLYNCEYVQNIINLLNCNRYLGLLVPLPVLHPYIGAQSEWYEYYDNIKELNERLKLNTLLDKSKKNSLSPITIGWFKTSALRELFDADFSAEDFADEKNELYISIQNIIPYVAQHNLYYSSGVITQDWLKIECDIKDQILSSVVMCNVKPKENVHFKDVRRIIKKYIKKKFKLFYKG